MTIAEDFKVRMTDRPSGFISELARRLKDEVKDNTPYVSGRLSRGWRAKGSASGVVRIWNNTIYAENVDEKGKSAGYASSILKQRVVWRLAREIEEEAE
jgi:hypothetical protein